MSHVWNTFDHRMSILRRIGAAILCFPLDVFWMLVKLGCYFIVLYPYHLLNLTWLNHPVWAITIHFVWCHLFSASSINIILWTWAIISKPKGYSVLYICEMILTANQQGGHGWKLYIWTKCKYFLYLEKQCTWQNLT